MSATIKQSLLDQLDNKSARVAILGLGYVGLPLAVVFAEAGFKVTGIDPDLAQSRYDLPRREPYPGCAHSSKSPGWLALGQADSHQRFFCVAAGGCRQHLCAHPAAQDRRPRSVFHPQCDQRTGEIYASRHGGRAGIDHLSGHNPRRSCCQSWVKKKVWSWRETFSWLSRPNGLTPGAKDWTTINTPKVIGGITADLHRGSRCLVCTGFADGCAGLLC